MTPVDVWDCDAGVWKESRRRYAAWRRTIGRFGPEPLDRELGERHHLALFPSRWLHGGLGSRWEPEEDLRWRGAPEGGVRLEEGVVEQRETNVALEVLGDETAQKRVDAEGLLERAPEPLMATLA